MNYEIVRLEDGINYLILKEQEVEGSKYLYLVNVNDEEDFVIRKEVGDELIGLTEEEFDKVVRVIISEEIKELEE